MRVLVLLLASLSGCSSLTHFDEYQAAGDGAARDGGSMDAVTPPTDGDLGDCPPIAESCNGRDDDCDGEVDEASADAACIAGAHATGACSSGSCVYTCETGFGDCDEQPNDCEADLGNPATCRACDVTCSGDTPLCSATGCTARCPAGQTECGGACVVTATDVAHCGGCLMPCMTPNGTPRCASGECEIAACDPLWADCDMNAANGCEQRLETADDCGGCGIACAPSHATGSCLGGTCAIVTCESGWDDCDGRATNGCEADLSRTATCGDCGTACPAAGAHADVDCDPATFECVYSCDDPRYADCDGDDVSCEADLSVDGNCGSCGTDCTTTCIALAGGGWGCAGAEICGNGLDDDSDSLIDCADTADCMDTHVCVPPIPPGWMGPLQLYDGPRTGAPSCSGAFATGVYDGFDALSPGSHTCSMCSCGSPTGITCRPPDVTAWISGATVSLDGGAPRDGGGTFACSGCMGTFGSSASCQLWDGGSCSDTLGTYGVDIGPSPASGGSCTPSGGSPMLGSPMFNDLGRACMPSSGGAAGGCMTGTTCWPRPQGTPFIPKYCIQRTGMFACPAGPYTVQHVFYESFSDTRGCSTCSCMTPTGATCSGAVAFYGAGSGTACSSDYLATYNTATPCGPVSRSAFHSIFVGGSSFTGGTCTRAGGAPTGSVTPTMPTTFCCLP